jgi:hypothetical protein
MRESSGVRKTAPTLSADAGWSASNVSIPFS